MTLQRRTGLRRTGIRRTTTPRRRRPRDTGPTKATKDALWERAGGRCEVCGQRITSVFSRHHRLPRRMGGSSNPAINTLPNLLLLCGTATTPDGCHRLIESDRLIAYGYGHLLRDGQDPAQTAVRIRAAFCFLTTDGRYADHPNREG